MISAARRHDRPDPAPTADSAARLIALVRECLAARVARHALVLALSRLPPAFARPVHRRLARAALDPLRAADRAREFVLPNGDVAIVWRGDARPALAATVDALARLFLDAGPGAPNVATLCHRLDLPDQAETLLRLAAASMEAPSRAGAADTLLPLDAAALTALEAALERADVARFVRRRPIYAVPTGGGFQPCWEKRLLSVPELAAVMAPGRAVAREPWLFRRLTRVLDRRMLALLSAPSELAGAGPFSIDLNVASILAPEFLRFDAALPAALRCRVTLDLLAADILADLPSFLFARDFARSRGYRLLLRGVGADLLAAMPLGRLGLDLMQIRWSRELAQADPDWLGTEPGRLVLARADNATAITWGRLRGIGFFQDIAIVTEG